jgi:hypothetical protein
MIRTLALCFLLSTPLVQAQQHLVPLGDVQQKAVEQSQARAADLNKLLSAFENPAARQALSAAGLNEGRLRQSAALLSDEELARLATRADRASNDFAAGVLNNQEITYILIALATAVIILVLVAI